MSTTPVNIEASDKRVERSPAFLRHFWPGFDPPTCEIIASRQPQHLLPPSIVPVILYLSKKDGGRRVKGGKKKKRKEEKKTLKWKSGFEDFEFIYSVRAVAVIRLCNLQACAIHRIAYGRETEQGDASG